MYKYAYLILVSGENNNKYYKMEWRNELDSEFVVTYGRVDVTAQTDSYPVHKWNSVLNSKIRKGYKDVTPFKKVSAVQKSFKSLEYLVNVLVDKLQNYASNSVKTNYTISGDSVTPQQLEVAQTLLNQAIDYTKTFSFHEFEVNQINNLLLELYTTLPRKMGNVRDYLVNNNWDISRLSNFLTSEQDILDSLESQVNVANLDVKDDLTILDALGLSITYISEKLTIDQIKDSMTDSSHLFAYAYRVINKKTQKQFDDFLPTVYNTKNVQKLFHASRNQNWFSILQSGLLIRPAGAIHTGSMMNDGCYFASRAKKSIGYSSLSGSYWAKGNNNEGYLGIFDVNLGNMLEIKSDSERHQYLRKMNYNDLLHMSKNSVYANSKSGWLYNDEYVVYNPAQCTIRYLVELKQ